MWNHALPNEAGATIYEWMRRLLQGESNFGFEYFVEDISGVLLLLYN